MRKTLGLILVVISQAIFATEPPVLPQVFTDLLASQNGKVLETKTYGNNNEIMVVHASVQGADHSDAFYIILNDQILDIDEYASISQLNINTQPNYPELFKKFPNVGIWPGNHEFPKKEILPGGITQLIFNYRLLNGCHACELAGIANVGFNFDNNGNYLGDQLLSLSPSPVK